MLINIDRRFFYGLLLPGAVITISGLIWYNHHCRKKEQSRINRSEYLVVEIQVPDYCVGSLIGKGGEKIKRFQQDYSVRCAFAKDDKSTTEDKYRRMIVRGQRRCVYEAEVELRRLIADLPRYEEIEMFVPENVCGYLIGKNGKTIREIRDVSKAKLNFDRQIIDHLEDKRLSRLKISGTAEQISNAKTLIEERLFHFEQKQQHQMSLDLDLERFTDQLNANGLSIDETDSQDGDLSNNNRQNPADKRAHHNALERKRRDHIKESFNDLRDVIPALKGEKASRAHVLKAATDYIRTIKSKTQRNRQTIEDLKKQNAIYDLQTQLLERVKETGYYARNLLQPDSSVLIKEETIPATQNLLADNF